MRRMLVVVGHLKMLAHPLIRESQTLQQLAELGDPDQLVHFLVETRFMDAHPEHRLVVHDWHEHAPNGIKAQLMRTRKGFATGPERATEHPKKSLRDLLSYLKSSLREDFW